MSKGSTVVKFRCEPALHAWMLKEFERWKQNSKYGGGSFSDFVRSLVVDELKHKVRGRRSWKCKVLYSALLPEMVADDPAHIVPLLRPNHPTDN